MFSILETIVPILPWILIPVALIVILLSFWKKCPADQAIVITGLKKRVLSGKGGFIIPFLETYCIISLENINMQTSVVGAPSKQGIFVDVNGTAVVKVNNNDTSIAQAVEQFSNNGAENTVKVIQKSVDQILEGKLRGIVSTMTVEQINEDRASFETKIEEDIRKELEFMGLLLVSYSIQKIATQGGYLENRAKPQVARAKADAEIAEAERKMDTDIKTAVARQEGEKARLVAEAIIAESERDKKIKTEKFREEQETAKARADVAYDIQSIENKGIIEDKNVILAEKRAKAVEKQLIAEVEKPAEAERNRVEIQAEAEKIKRIKMAQAEAETLKLEANARAEALKIEAQAKAEALKLEGQAQAEIIKAKGIADADAIKAKGIAEAEAKSKLAEAMKQYGEAAVVDMLVDRLPDIVGAIAKPMEQIDKITILDNGGNGTSKVAKAVTSVAGEGFEVIKTMTGLDIAELISNFTKPKTTSDVVDIDEEDIIRDTISEDTV